MLVDFLSTLPLPRGASVDVPDSPQARPPTARTEKTSCLVSALVGVTLAIVAGAVFARLAARWWPATPSALSHPAVGQNLARLELRPLTGDGQPVGLDDLSGQVVLLNFWGTWCGSCLMELPDMARIEKAFRDRDDFRFLAVSCGPELPEDLDTIRLETSTLLLAEHINMPTYTDPAVVTRRAVDQAVGLKVFPTTLILDRRGVIRGVWIGNADRGELDAAVAIPFPVFCFFILLLPPFNT